MSFKQNRVVRIKPATTEVERQLLRKLIDKRLSQSEDMPKLQKPRRVDRDKETYFRAEFYCPVCGERLASYTYGRAWTDNGLCADRRVDCRNCGQMIDWVGVPGEEWL